MSGIMSQETRFDAPIKKQCIQPIRLLAVVLSQTQNWWISGKCNESFVTNLTAPVHTDGQLGVRNNSSQSGFCGGCNLKDAHKSYIF